MDQNRPLRGKSVLLSVAVPSGAAEEYKCVPKARLLIDDAVVDLARTIFYYGGKIVMRNVPEFTPLVAMILSDYWHVPDQQERVGFHDHLDVYRSAAFRPEVSDRSMIFAKSGYLTIHWIEPDPDESQQLSKGSGGPTIEASLQSVRRATIREQKPTCMVVIGGLEGEEADFNAFVSVNKPVFVLVSTGGAAARLAEVHPEKVRAIDTEVISSMELPYDPWQAVPYPFIMQMVAREIVGLP